MPTAPAPQPARLPWPLWSCYVACSWTWLIGMFLPVILMHEFGGWAWVVFAVPNVIGAMSVGFVFRDPERSQKFVAAHRPAMLAFSYVTIAFHSFVMGWLGVLLVVVFALPVMALIFRRRARWLPVAALVVFLTSLFAGYDFWRETAGFGVEGIPPVAEGVRPIVWFWLACGTSLGFLTCPHLDLTLHRAAQNCRPHHNPAAFLLGFGLLFVLLILLTAAYAPLAQAVLGTEDVGSLLDILPFLLIIHIGLQAAFTICCHAQELPEETWPRSILVLIAMAAAAFAGIQAIGVSISIPGLPEPFVLGDLLYRGWMGAYAVVFPAYVVLCVLPNRGKTDDEAKPSRKQLIVWLVACVVTLPMFALGFIGGQMVWVGVAVGLILLSLVLVKPANTAKTAPPADA